MFQRLLWTRNDYVLTIARLALGLIILPHGMQKLFGAFGGFGFGGTMGFFTGTLGVPAALAFVATVAEFIGGTMLIAGIFGRLGALLIGVQMLVAALLVHMPNGFFMNWFGTQQGEGLEFFLLAIGLALVVLIGGSGAASADGVLAAKADG